MEKEIFANETTAAGRAATRRPRPGDGKASINVLAKTQKECKEKLAQAIEKNGKIDVTKAGAVYG